MPDGLTHYKYYKMGFTVLLPESILISFYDIKFGLGTLCGYFCGRWIDPDWDTVTANNAESRIMNEIPIFGNILFGISSIYGGYTKRLHRSFWTHFPIISTLGRLIFVGTPILLLAEFVEVNLIGNGWQKFWLGFWWGLSQADAIHWWLDLQSEK